MSEIRAIVILCIAMTAGCTPLNGEFACTSDASCMSGSRPGFCEPTGLCSVQDNSCPSTHRYTGSAGLLSGQCTTPSDCIKEVWAGGHATCARTSDGVFCWGDGNGIPTQLMLPAGITPGDVMKIALGGFGVCALAKNQAVYCAPDIHQPQVKIPQLAVIDVSVGTNHACAVTVNQQVACWGLNTFKQLGDKTTQFDNGTITPQQVPPVIADNHVSNVSQVSAGRETTCALTPTTSNANVWCWGANDSGQLGCGLFCSADDHGVSTPSMNADLITTWTVVTSADRFACARGTGSEVSCWGDNTIGQLGDPMPDVPSGYPSGVVQQSGVLFERVNAGGGHACAVAKDGPLRCWGENQFGQSIPDPPNSDPVREPAVVKDGAGAPLNAVDVTAGSEHTCARTSNKGVLCWGNNLHGELGNGTKDAVTRPTAPLLTCR